METVGTQEYLLHFHGTHVQLAGPASGNSQASEAPVPVHLATSSRNHRYSSTCSMYTHTHTYKWITFAVTLKTVSEHVCGLMRVIPLKGRINRKESGYMKCLYAVSSRPLLIEKNKQESEAQIPSAQVIPWSLSYSTPHYSKYRGLAVRACPPLLGPLQGPVPKGEGSEELPMRNRGASNGAGTSSEAPLLWNNPSVAVNMCYSHWLIKSWQAGSQADSQIQKTLGGERASGKTSASHQGIRMCPKWSNKPWVTWQSINKKFGLRVREMAQ